MIPYGRQSISEDDIESVVDILRSDFLTQGPAVPAFEKAVAKTCGANYAIATNSATSALHIACLALGIGKNDIVWTSPITFVASANCVLYCGAKVDFVDIDPRTYNISVTNLEEKLQVAAQIGVLPKALIAVHFAGQSCEMESIFALSKKYGFVVIEDASHAIGAKYKDVPVGSCKYSDVAIFSFHPVKIITTGEGGMALTNQHDLMEKMALLRSHGITRDPLRMVNKSELAWHYEQIDLGFNYRMTDIQAALGISQINKLNEFVGSRHKLASQYDIKLAQYPVILPWQNQDAYSSFHLYVMLLNLGEDSQRYRDKLFAIMRDHGIGVNLHYIPVYRHPYFQKLGFDFNSFPAAEDYYRRAITLPLFPGLLESQQERVVELIENTLLHTID